MCTVTFKDFDISEPWARADNACKKKGMVLSQIDNINLLDLTKARLYKGSYSSKIYWTGLSFYKKKLSWSDGRQVFCNGSLSGVLHCDGLTLNLNSRLCFVVTAINNTLQRSDCNVAQRFICQTGEFTSGVGGGGMANICFHLSNWSDTLCSLHKFSLSFIRNKLSETFLFS